MRLHSAGVTLREAQDEEGYRWSVVLIAPGLSKNGVMYEPAVLQTATPLFEGARALARSDQAHCWDHDVSAQNVCGWFSGVEYAEGTGVVGTFEITEDAEWLAKKLRSAWKRGKRDLVGFSLVATGEAHRVVSDGALIVLVDKLTEVEFVDVVVRPAAGGRVLNLVASVTQEKDTQMLQDLLRLLESKRPDLYAKLDAANVTEAQVLALLGDAVPEAAATETTSTASLTEAQHTTQATTQTVTEADRLLQRLQLDHCRLALREALADCGLSDFMRTRLRNQFTRRLEAGQVFDDADLTAAIADARELAGHFSESGKVKGFGAGTATVTEDEDEQGLQRLLDFFDGKTHSFKEAYIQCTGDTRLRADLHGMRVKFGNWPRLAEAKGVRLRASLSSTSFDQVLADVMHKRMVAEYQRPELNTWRQIVVLGSLADFKTQHRTRFGGYGNLPIVAERAAYTALTSPSDDEATYVPRKRGGTEDLSWEMIRNDDANAIRFIPIRLGRAAGQTLHEFVWDFVATNPTIYDSVALFHASHGNLTATAFGTDATQFLAHRLAMRQQTEAGSSKRLGLTPRYLAIPGDLENAAYNAFQRTTNNDANFAQTVAPTILTVDYWTDGNNWFTFADPMACPGIEIGFLDGEEEPDILLQGESDSDTQGTMFSNDVRTYKVRHCYGGAVLDYRGMQGALVA